MCRREVTIDSCSIGVLVGFDRVHLIDRQSLQESILDLLPEYRLGRLIIKNEVGVVVLKTDCVEDEVV